MCQVSTGTPAITSHMGLWKASCVNTAVENIGSSCPLVKKYLFSVCHVSNTSL